MHFHRVSFGSQHEMWSKQHNGKVRLDVTDTLILRAYVCYQCANVVWLDLANYAG